MHLQVLVIKFNKLFSELNTDKCGEAIVGALINVLLMRKLTYIHFIINPADLKDPDFYEAGTRCHPATAPINLRAL